MSALPGGGVPASAERPSRRAFGTRRMKAGSVARAPACAAISASATSLGSARLTSAPVRSMKERISADVP